MSSSQDGTRIQTMVLLAFSFLTASTYVFMRALATSLFLARVGPEGLPVAFAFSAFVVIVVSGLTQVVIRKIPAHRAAIGTWILLGALTLLVGNILEPLHHSLIVLSALYVFAEVRGSLNTIYVVTLSNEAFARNHSNRPYAIVASGAPIAGILVGFILGIEASLVLLMPAIITIASLDLIAGITISLFLPHKSKSNAAESPAQHAAASNLQKDIDSEKRSGQSRYRKYLAVLVGLQIAVLTLLGYQWKAATGEFFGSNEVQMLSYFAIFYAISDSLIVLLQWLVVGRLLDRFGIGIGLIGFPLALGLIAIAALFVHSPYALLVVFTIGMGLNVVRRALHDPELTVAFTILDSLVRPETIVFVKGIIKPFSEATAACLLLVVGGVIFEYWITSTWLLLTLPWYYFAIRVTMIFRTQRQDADESSKERKSHWREIDYG